jgi:hypothetical protein
MARADANRELKISKHVMQNASVVEETVYKSSEIAFKA